MGRIRTIEPAVLRVKNWQKFQHYKHRCPPWIKLAGDTFQNPNFTKLQDASKLLAVCIWTLASRSHDGSVPDNFAYIKHWGFLQDVEIKHYEELIEAGFLVRASKSLAHASKLRTNAATEGETETETETEGEAEKNAAQAPVLPAWLPAASWNAFLEMRKANHAKLTPRAKLLLIGKLEKLGRDGEDPAAVLDQSTMNCWKSVYPVHGEGNNGRPRYQTAKDRQRETDQQAIEFLREQAARRKSVPGDPPDR